MSDLDTETEPQHAAQEPLSLKGHRLANERRGRFKAAVNWLVLLFGGFYLCFHVGFVVWNAVQNKDWLLKIVQDHFAALVGLPFVAFAAVCLVLFLEARSEKEIEFSAVGFSFKGASAPIILWALCFLVISVCFKLLWNP